MSSTVTSILYLSVGSTLKLMFVATLLKLSSPLYVTVMFSYFPGAKPEILNRAVPFSNGSKCLLPPILITIYPVAVLFTVTLIISFSPYVMLVGVAFIGVTYWSMPNVFHPNALV